MAAGGGLRGRSGGLGGRGWFGDEVSFFFFFVGCV